MRSILLSAVFLLTPSLSLLAQEPGALWLYAHPYQAEAIRLGGAYTAVGRGLASMHSNSAALAFQQGARLQFSRGRSQKSSDTDIDTELNNPYTIAAAVSIPGTNVALGISIDRDELDIEPRNTNDSYLFRHRSTRLGIHLARQMSDWLSVGAAIRQHQSHIQALGSLREGSSATATAWDLSLSVHGRHRAQFLGRPSDEVRYGLTLDNILGTDVWYIDETQKDHLNQVLRAGAAYFWNPDMGRMLNANALSVLLTVESSLQGTEHEFRNWGTVGGAAELRILEVLMLSAGLENIVRLGNRYGYWPEYPVLRYGAGLDIPLDRLFDLDLPITVQIDYAHTEWNSDDDEYPYWYPADDPQQVNAFSLQLIAEVF